MTIHTLTDGTTVTGTDGSTETAVLTSLDGHDLAIGFYEPLDPTAPVEIWVRFNGRTWSGDTTMALALTMRLAETCGLAEQRGHDTGRAETVLAPSGKPGLQVVRG